MEPNTPEPHHHSHHRKERWKVTPWQVIIFWDHARDTEVYFFRTEQGAKDYADSQKCAEGVRAIGVRHYDPARTAQQNATVEAWYKCGPRALTSSDLSTIDSSPPDPEDVGQSPGGAGGGGGEGQGGQQQPQLTKEQSQSITNTYDKLLQQEDRLNQQYACPYGALTFIGPFYDIPSPSLVEDIRNGNISPNVLDFGTLPAKVLPYVRKDGTVGFSDLRGVTQTWIQPAWCLATPPTEPGPGLTLNTKDLPTGLQQFIDFVDEFLNRLKPLKQLEEIPGIGLEIAEVVETISSIFSIAKDIAKLFNGDEKFQTIIDLTSDLIGFVESIVDFKGAIAQVVGLIKGAIKIEKRVVELLKEFGLPT